MCLTYPQFRERIVQAAQATTADEFDVFIGLAEAVETGDEVVVGYAVDLIERMWQ